MWKSTDACVNAAVGGTFTENGVEFIKLKDNKCWTKSSQGWVMWASAASKCPSGTHLPSVGEFTKLLTAYGGTQNSSYGSPYGWYDGDGDLYNATGWYISCWSSTVYASNTSYAWNLNLGSSDSNVYYRKKDNYRSVVCIRS